MVSSFSPRGLSQAVAFQDVHAAHGDLISCELTVSSAILGSSLVSASRRGVKSAVHVGSVGKLVAQ